MPATSDKLRFQKLWLEHFPPEPRHPTALLISGSPAGASSDLSRHLLRHLLRLLAQQAGFICAVDSGADRALEASISPDLLIGDFDSIQPHTLEIHRAAGAEIIAVDPYKDASDLELALAVLQNRGFTEVIATNVFGGRIDHELASLGALSRAQALNPVLIESETIAVFLSAQSDRKRIDLGFLFPGEKNGSLPISILPLNGEATIVAQGFEWPLDRETLRPLDARGVANLITDPTAYIEVTSGTAAIILPLVF